MANLNLNASDRQENAAEKLVAREDAIESNLGILEVTRNIRFQHKLKTMSLR